MTLFIELDNFCQQMLKLKDELKLTRLIIFYLNIGTLVATMCY